MLYLFFHFTATAPKLSAESSVKLSIAELESGKSGPDKTSRTGNGPSQYMLHRCGNGTDCSRANLTFCFHKTDINPEN